MSFNVSLIQLNGDPKTVKEAVISLLSNEWPLSAKQILAKGKNGFGFNVSTQAIYKTLKQLESQGIVKKNAQEYSLNIEWLEKTKQVSAKIHDMYSQTKLNPDKQNSFTFSTIHESDLFLLDIALKNAPENKNDNPLILHWSHYWVPLFLSLDEYKKIKEALTKYRVFGLVRGNTVVDKWCDNFWNKQGFNTKTGADVASTADLIVFKDTIIQVFYQEDIKQALDEFYSTPKQIQDLDLNSLFEKVFLKKTKIHVEINKNRALAEQLTEQTKKMFDRGTI